MMRQKYILKIRKRFDWVCDKFVGNGSPPLEKGDKRGFLIENCLLLQKSPLTPLYQRGVIHSLPTNLSHTRFDFFDRFKLVFDL